VQAVAAKPSAVFYYLAGTAYPVPPFVFEQVLPAYEYWRPRLQTTLALWHSNVKETCRSTLLMAMHYLLTQERFSPIGQWIQAHLALLTQILAILCYIVAFWLVRLLLRLIF
jgi:hypothetical protein